MQYIDQQIQKVLRRERRKWNFQSITEPIINLFGQTILFRANEVFDAFKILLPEENRRSPQDTECSFFSFESESSETFTWQSIDLSAVFWKLPFSDAKAVMTQQKVELRAQKSAPIIIQNSDFFANGLPIHFCAIKDTTKRQQLFYILFTFCYSDITIAGTFFYPTIQCKTWNPYVKQMIESIRPIRQEVNDG